MLERSGEIEPPLCAGNRDYRERFEEYEEAAVEVDLVRATARPPVVDDCHDDQEECDSLARHRYKLSPGTLYPLLSAMEQRGYIKSRKQREGRTARKLYRATPLGKKGLALAKVRLKEFTGEAMEG